MSSLIPVGIVILLILLNGLFVAAEFAIVGVSRMEVERAVREKKRGARILQFFVEDARNKDRFIATAQLGITAASLGLGMYGEHKLAVWIAGQLEGWGPERWIAAHTAGTVIAISILTYFHIVVGEMVPKALALQKPGPVSLGVSPLMRGIQLAVYPVVLLLNGIGNLILRIFGIVRSGEGADRYRSPAEIAYIVRESEAGGMLRKESAQVVAELLDFGNLTAAEVMVPRVHVTWLSAAMDINDLRDVLETHPHTRYPVFEGGRDHVVGMVHIRDVLRWAKSGVGFDHAHLRQVPHVPMTATTNEVLTAMRRSGVQMAVVMDEHGGTEGIVTLEDLFEEVVGDITERPGEQPAVSVIDADGTARTAGSARLDELGEALDIVLEHEEVDTVSGLILDLLGRPPKVGDAVEYDNVRLEVLEVRGHGVGTALATPLDTPLDDEEVE